MFLKSFWLNNILFNIIYINSIFIKKIMSSNLKYWQDKIKEKRKKTTFRNFLKEIGSWVNLVLHKNN